MVIAFLAPEILRKLNNVTSASTSITTTAFFAPCIVHCMSKFDFVKRRIIFCKHLCEYFNYTVVLLIHYTVHNFFIMYVIIIAIITVKELLSTLQTVRKI